jgi:hypothetical protein
MMTRCETTIVLAIAAATMTIMAVSAAQATTVKEIFEKHKLLGTFAMDCDQPPSRDKNWYYITRVMDDDHVQRDLMWGESETTRAGYIVLDKAEERSGNEIYVSGTADDQDNVEGIWRVEQVRMLQWDSTRAGKKVISSGKWVTDQFPVPWFYRCGD